MVRLKTAVADVLGGARLKTAGRVVLYTTRGGPTDLGPSRPPGTPWHVLDPAGFALPTIARALYLRLADDGSPREPRGPRPGCVPASAPRSPCCIGCAPLIAGHRSARDVAAST